MIRDVRLRLAITTADYNQASCTCDRRHVSIQGGGGRLFLRFFLIFCCTMITCGDSKNRMSRGIKDLQIALQPQPPSWQTVGHCDLEPNCDWYWERQYTNQKTANLTFEKVMASTLFDNPYFPIIDANGSTNGTEILGQSYVFERKIGAKLIKKYIYIIYIYITTFFLLILYIYLYLYIFIFL